MTCGLLVTTQINNVSTGVLQEGNKSLAVVTESMLLFFFLGGGLIQDTSTSLSFSKEKMSNYIGPNPLCPGPLYLRLQ